VASTLNSLTTIMSSPRVRPITAATSGLSTSGTLAIST
jgi:hypothetical protein